MQKADKHNFSDLKKTVLSDEAYPLEFIDSLYKVLKNVDDNKVSYITENLYKVYKKMKPDYGYYYYYFYWGLYCLLKNGIEPAEYFSIMDNQSEIKDVNLEILIDYMCYGLDMNCAIELLKYDDYQKIFDLFTCGVEYGEIIQNIELRKEYAIYIVTNNIKDFDYEILKKYLFQNKPLSDFINCSCFSSVYKNKILNEYIPKFPLDKKSSKTFQCMDEARNASFLDCICEYQKKTDEKEIIITTNFDYGTVYVSKGKSGVKLSFSKYGKTKFELENEKKSVTPADFRFHCEMVIFYDNPNLIYEQYNGRIIPLSLKHALFYKLKLGNTFSDFFVPYCKRVALENQAMKDIEAFYTNSAYNGAVPPLIINDFTESRSYNNYFRTKYKKGYLFNWNKHPIDLCYITMKCLDRIEKKYWNQFIEYMFDNKEKYDVKDVVVKNIVDDILEYVIFERIDKSTYYRNADNKIISDYEFRVIVKDYVKICRMAGKKVNFRFNSARKLKEAHDDVTIFYMNKSVPEIKIPQNSVFNQLRKQLPDDFEWIKNRKRIIKEGTDMHHCVASYAEKINKDKCAIYSFVYKDKKRYTIEFIYTKNNRYSIRQIQGMCDRGRPEEVSEYVNSFI